ncbi:MAG: lactate utilization protein [Acidobacteria bacterium]|nr:lactate utilization protein [Acidobacteriota bacterium]
MTAREEVLDGVRKALGRSAGQAPAAAPEARIVIPEIDVERRFTMFSERLELVGGKTYRAADLDAARAITVEIMGGETGVASNAPLLAQAGITGLPGVATGFMDEAALRAACAVTPFGITTADYALAETGSLVTRSATEARLISLLPPVHIALLPISRLLTGLDELYTRIPLPSEETASMVFITGPSRSADIEMILVRGVHGPRVIHVIVVNNI